MPELNGFVSPDRRDRTGHGHKPARSAADGSAAGTVLPSPGPIEHSGRYGEDGHYCSMLAIDIKGFSDRRSGDDVQRFLRVAMYGLLTGAFGSSRLPWLSCHHEDRGDGVLVVAPPGAPAAALIDPLVDHLRAGIRRHNQLASELARIRLRMSVHAGQVHFDRNGVCGKAVTYLFRMLEAAAFKRAFDLSGADFGLVASGALYDDVISHAPGLIDPGLYAPITIRCKETRGRAWLYLPPVRNPFLPGAASGTRKMARQDNERGSRPVTRRRPSPESANGLTTGGPPGEGRYGEGQPGQGPSGEGRSRERGPQEGPPGSGLHSKGRPGAGPDAERVPLPAAIAAVLPRQRGPVPADPAAREGTSALLRLMANRDVPPKGWLAIVHGSNAVQARFRGRLHPGQRP